MSKRETKISAFFDTNFLIQCIDLSQIKFADLIGPFDVLELLLAEPVIKEMDKFKTDSNQRRASQARKYNSLFRKMYFDPNGEYPIFEKPKVILKFAPVYKRDQLEIIDSGLDVSKSDDELIASVLKYKLVNTEADVCFIVNDTAVLIKSKNLQIKEFAVPDDWLLPPESDPHTKKIRALELEIKHLLDKCPKIRITPEIRDINGAKLEKLQLKTYSQLQPEQVESLIQIVQKKQPMKVDYSDEDDKAIQYNESMKFSEIFRLTKKTYNPPCKQSIEKYINTDYPSWIDGVKEWLNHLHEYLYKNNNRYLIDVSLSNQGTVFAYDVHLDFSLLKGGEFIPEELKNDESFNIPELPIIPDHPRGTITETNMFPKFDAQPIFNPMYKTDFMNMIPSLKDHQRDKHSFYYISKPTKCFTCVQFTCDEFRHQDKDKVFCFNVAILNQGEVDKVKLEYKITGKNIPKAISQVLTFEVDTFPGDTYNEAINLISSQYGITINK